MTFVVSDGALVQLEQARPALGTRGNLTLSSDLVSDYASLWRTQPAVRTVISFLARNIAGLGLHAFERVDDSDRRRISSGPLYELLERPGGTGVTGTSRYRLINALVHDLGIYDQAFWLKLRVGGNSPRALLRIPPWMVDPVGSSLMEPTGFLIRGARGKLSVPRESMVYFHGFNPDDARLGCSPLEALRQTLAEEWQAGQYREQVFRNGGRFSGYIERPAEAPEWGDAGKQRFRADWQAQYTGDGPSAGGTPILEDGMRFVPSAQTSEQAQYVQGRKLTREEVAAAYFIPPPMVGLLDNATFSNITEQHKMLYQDTLGPRLEEIQADLEIQLVPEFDDQPGRTYVEFNLSEKLRGSFEEQASALQTATGAPYLLRSEARARLNLPRIDGADTLVVPLNVLEGGQASPTDSAPKALGHQPGLQVKARAHDRYQAKHAKVLKAFFERQGQVVKSLVGAGADTIGAVWDGKRWDRELGDDLYRLAVLTSKAVAGDVLDGLAMPADAYDVDRTLAFLRAVADRVAANVNQATKDQVDAHLGDDDPLTAIGATFDTATSSRAEKVALTAVTTWSGFATVETGRQVGGASKTWETGPNARPSHARMNGETVGIDETFSNGADWPCDPSLGADDVAGCNCSVSITTGD
jgi:HK97 family phage portal protein